MPMGLKALVDEPRPFKPMKRDRYPTDPPRLLESKKEQVSMRFHEKFLGNMYMFTVFPFVELWSSFARRGSCGLGALATCAAVLFIGLMAVGAVGGWLLGLPPYLTFLTLPVLISFIGAVASDTTL